MSSIGASERPRVDWTTDRAAIDAELSALCDRCAPNLGDRAAEVVRYALLGGGKRLRGLLVLEAYRAAGGVGNATPLAVIIIEFFERGTQPRYQAPSLAIIRIDTS